MSVMIQGGSRRSSRRNGSRRKHYGGHGVADQAMPLNGVPHVEGLGPAVSKPFVQINPHSQGGGHRCSMRHKRSKRTRKAHAGRKSRKHKSRGKKYGMGLRGIFGRS